MKGLKRKFFMLKLALISNGYKKAKYLKTKKYFGAIGEDCYLQPYNYGTEPYLIFLGNNVCIASNVTFINHDITYKMFNNLGGGVYHKYIGKIVVGNNVFIGTNVTILYNVKIGNNVIIGANSLINSDVPNDSVVAGIPAHVIGDFSEFKHRRLIYSQTTGIKETTV